MANITNVAPIPIVTNTRPLALPPPSQPTGTGGGGMPPPPPSWYRQLPQAPSVRGYGGTAPVQLAQGTQGSYQRNENQLHTPPAQRFSNGSTPLQRAMIENVPSYDQRRQYLGNNPILAGVTQLPGQTLMNTPKPTGLPAGVLPSVGAPASGGTPMQQALANGAPSAADRIKGTLAERAALPTGATLSSVDPARLQANTDVLKQMVNSRTPTGTTGGGLAPPGYVSPNANNSTLAAMLAGQGGNRTPNTSPLLGGNTGGSFGR